MEKGIYKHNILQVSCFPSELTMFTKIYCAFISPCTDRKTLFGAGVVYGHEGLNGCHVIHGAPEGGIIPEFSPEVYPLSNSLPCQEISLHVSV